jgi:hypothetical protein
LQKPEGFRVKAFEGESSRESAGLRALSNAESEVLRLSLRVNNMAISTPSFEFTNGDIQKFVILLSYR